MQHWTIQTACLVALGGGLGSVLRFSLFFFPSQSSFPFYATTGLTNLLACILLGAWVAYGGFSSPKLHGLIAVGFCGGLSTFSTFSYEAYLLFSQKQYGILMGYISLSIALGILSIAAMHKFFSSG